MLNVNNAFVWNIVYFKLVIYISRSKSFFAKVDKIFIHSEINYISVLLNSRSLFLVIASYQSDKKWRMRGEVLFISIYSDGLKLWG